jgi:hypothetical protein
LELNSVVSINPSTWRRCGKAPSEVSEVESQGLGAANDHYDGLSEHPVGQHGVDTSPTSDCGLQDDHCGVCNRLSEHIRQGSIPLRPPKANPSMV